MKPKGALPDHLNRELGDSRTAPFAQVGCAIHARHDPDPATSELHHVFPLYLQARIWEDVNTGRPTTAHDKERLPLCPTGHADVHSGLEAMIQGKSPPHGVGTSERHLAAEAIRRYRGAGGKD